MRRVRGFILAAAIAACLAMIVIAMILASQARNMEGFTQNMEAEGLETEGAAYTFSRLRGALQGNGVLTNLTLPLPANGTVTFKTPVLDEGTNISPVNMTCQITNLIYSNPLESGYANATALVGATGVNVPACHAGAVLTATVPNERSKQKYLGMFSSACPYAVIAETGRVDVNSVRSVSRYDSPISQTGGLMAHVYGRQSVVIATQLNGHAYSPGPVNIGQGGIPHPQWTGTPVPIPPDFVASMNNYKAQVRVATGTRLMEALTKMNKALHNPGFFPPLGAAHPPFVGSYIRQQDPLSGPSDPNDVATIKSPGDSDFDSPGGTLTVGTSLRIPDGSERLQFSQVNVSGHLVLEEGTVLHVLGNLQVSGNVFLGASSSLVVDGTLDCGGICATGPRRLPISRAAQANQVNMKDTMLYAASAGFTGTPATGVNNPFVNSSITYVHPPVPPPGTTPPPYTVPNGVYAAFDPLKVAQLAELTVGPYNLAQFLGTATPTGFDQQAVPGIAVLGDTIQTSGSNSLQYYGLFYATADLTLNGGSSLVGVAWARNSVRGNIHFRYFPYYTQAQLRTPAGPVNISAVEYHSIAGAKLP